MTLKELIVGQELFVALDILFGHRALADLHRMALKFRMPGACIQISSAV